MTAHRLNANFLSPEQLEAFGVPNADKRNILIHSTAIIVDFAEIQLGDNIRIDPYVVISCRKLVLGNHIHIATACGIFGSATIRIGDFSGISGHTLIYSSTDDFSGKSLTGPTVPSEFLQVEDSEVELGRHCLVGAQSILLPGSNLDDGAAVGSASLVKGALPAWTISAGVPAKPIKDRARDCLDLEIALRNSKQN